MNINWSSAVRLVLVLACNFKKSTADISLAILFLQGTSLGLPNLWKVWQKYNKFFKVNLELQICINWIGLHCSMQPTQFRQEGLIWSKKHTSRKAFRMYEESCVNFECHSLWKIAELAFTDNIRTSETWIQRERKTWKRNERQVWNRRRNLRQLLA